MDSASSVARAIADCRASVAQLQADKVVLIRAVLALKQRDRAYWENALCEAREIVEASRQQQQQQAAAPSPSVQERQQQHQLLDLRVQKIAEYEALVAGATAGEAELRAMLAACGFNEENAKEDDDVNDFVRLLQGVRIDSA